MSVASVFDSAARDLSQASRELAAARDTSIRDTIARELAPRPIIGVPLYTDISKAANELLNKEFYHVARTAFEVKSLAPNNVAFKVNGKTSHDDTQSGAMEGRYTDKLNGLVLTQMWNTSNLLETKVELVDTIAKGLKLEGIFSLLPSNFDKGAKITSSFRQPNFHGRATFDVFKGPTAYLDAVGGHDGFLVGASARYNVNKAALTDYAASLGYVGPGYVFSTTGQDNMSVFSASYYHKVNSQVEAASKATWNSKTGTNHVGIEVACKYRLDPVSFAKIKINERGVAALAYQVLLRKGVKLGLGASIDTQKMDQSAPKLGCSFMFEG